MILSLASGAELFDLVEEFYPSGLEGILGGDDFEAVVLDEVCQDGGVLAELVGGGVDVGFDCLLDQEGLVVISARLEEWLDGGSDFFDDGADVRRAVFAGLLDLSNRCFDRTAAGVTENNHEASPELLGCKFYRSQQCRGDDVARDPNNKEIAESSVKDELHRCPRI